jgi:inactivated superfamily I helicase
MGATFTQQDAQQARYWYERRIYTAGPLTLNPGQTPIFTARNWTDPQQPDWIAELVGLWATQNSAVQLQWTFDSFLANQSQAQGYTDAAPAGVRRFDVYAPAVHQLILTANNTGTAPINNFQVNYEIALRRLTAAEKLMRGYALSAQDQQALQLLGSGGQAQVQDLVDRGTSPISIERQIISILDNRRLYDHPSGGLYHVTAGPTTAGLSFAVVTVPQGTFCALEEVAVEGAPSITLYADRDDDTSYLQLNGSAFVQADDAPWRVFVPFLRVLTLRASAAATTTAAVRVRIGVYALSNLWRVRLGLAKNPTDVPGDTWAKTWAGIA